MSAAPVRVRVRRSVSAALVIGFAALLLACAGRDPQADLDEWNRTHLECGMRDDLLPPPPPLAPMPAEPPEADPDAPRVNPPEITAEGLAVTQPEEARAFTPFPVVVRIAGAVGVERVLVRYKGFGGTRWKSLNLRQHEGSFVGEIDCKDLSTPGPLRYYVIAADEGGTPVATVGSLAAPLRVELTTKIKGPQPALPGRAPRPRCGEVLDEPSDRIDASLD